ncbi:MAG: hypothetical protein OXH99_01685 [Bryobacterales bacterium]|nr:hypothetical protein [Bryobacterales bacterium]
MGAQEIAAVRARLVEHAQEDCASLAEAEAEALWFRKPKDLDEAEYQEAKSLVNDLKHRPHAFVIGCIMDRQIDADRAWCVPYRLAQRIGCPEEPRFSFCTLLELSEDAIQGHMKGPPSLHWLHKEMSCHVHAALRRIADQYEGRAEKIWNDRPSSAGLVYRFLEFEGIGPKIATMAANILVRQFKIRVGDYSSLDISSDRHVHRVFHRLGLLPKGASREQVIYRARDLNPEYPGSLDGPVWEIGRDWCRPKNPNCSECFMKDICPTAARLAA